MRCYSLVLLLSLLFGSSRLLGDSVVVFNEVMYHPPADKANLEWVEIQNQHSVDVDLSGWSLDGDIHFQFPPGTLIPGGGYRVIASNPTALALSSGAPSILGPFAGRLSNASDRLILRNNNGRIMDDLRYGSDGDWPLGPDRAGPSLARRKVNLATSNPANWRASLENGGTPGRRNFSEPIPEYRSQPLMELSTQWRFDDSGAELGTAWKDPRFDDSRWSLGEGPFMAGIVSLPSPPRTLLATGRRTYFFRSHFNFAGNPSLQQLSLEPLVDAGAVIYLNGTEIARYNLPNGRIDAFTPALSEFGISDALPRLLIPAHALIVGDNSIAVEVHQGTRSSGYMGTILASAPNAYWPFSETSGDSQDRAPRLGPQDGFFQGVHPTNRVQAGPRPTDLVGGRPLSGFTTNNNATRFAGNQDGGNDVFLVPDSEALNFPTNRSFSIECWVNAPSVQEGGAGLWAHGTGGGGEQYVLDVVNGKYRFSSGSGTFPNRPTTLTSSVGPDATWQHLVAVMDPPTGVMKLFVNGIERGSTNAPPSLIASAHDLSIGSRQLAAGNYDLNFNGRIDEVSVYPRLLSSEEIQQHLESAFGTVEPELVDLDDAAFALRVSTLERLERDPSDLTIVFNEQGPLSASPFWLELMNLSAVPIDFSGYAIVNLLRFPPERYPLTTTTLAPFSRLLLSRDELGFEPGSGDRLALYNAQQQVLDVVRVESRGRARFPDGRGPWMAPNPSTPGEPNRLSLREELVINEIFYHPKQLAAVPATFTNQLVMPFTKTWRWRGDGQDLGTLWRAASFDDQGWNESSAPFAAPNNLPLPIPRGTPLNLTNLQGARIVTYYFRTTFPIEGDTSGFILHLRGLLDDGAVFYLNGEELLRWNMPSTNILAGTFASSNVVTVTAGAPIPLPSAALRQGLNTLAVEVHQVNLASTDAAMAVELSLRKELTPSVPARIPTTSFVEIYNRSSKTVLMEGWRLTQGVDFIFPAGKSLSPGGFLVIAENPTVLQGLHPGIDVLGPYSGRLAHGGDRVQLLDPTGNPADDVSYFDKGRWPEYADGGGSSLELRDARANTAQAEAWAASDESYQTDWETFRWRGIAQFAQPGEPTDWRELALCLLEGAGEVLLDDVSLIETPAGTPKQLIQNSGFDAGSPAHWRFLGNHSQSRVEPEAANPSNYVLHLKSSGPGEYQGNQIETTFVGSSSIANGKEYEISFRARWLAGASRLNTRLYFNRLARSFPLVRTERGGTPGRMNSRAIANLGPTFADLTQFPVVPAAGEPVKIQVRPEDPDGLQAVTLRYALGGSNAWTSLKMEAQGDGRAAAGIPGLPAGTLVQYYVEGQDLTGARATFPARGADSRALYRVREDGVSPPELHRFRILMTPQDASFLHTGTNTLSNELLGATVIYNDQEIYPDVGVRLKGSFVGRNVARVGFHLAFQPDQPFRGVHKSVSVDRSQHAEIGGVYELMSKHIAAHASGIPDMQDDIAYCLAPLPSYNTICTLRLTGFDPDWLDAQFDKGADGSLFEVEVLRWNLATIDGKPESPKLVGNEGGGTGYANLEVTDYGDDPESYRWFLLLVNNRDADDYSRGIAWCKALSAPPSLFESRIAEAVDVDQFLRVMAFQSLVGPGDAYYTGGNIHNFRVYSRPSDGRMLYMPWDWDSCFQIDASGSLFGSGNIARLIEKPDRRRRYLNHLFDIVSSTFNPGYMHYWAKHYGKLARQDLSPVQSYIATRSAFVLSQLPTKTPFAITSNGGTNFETNLPEINLTGTAPISVESIEVNGISYPILWTNNTVWRLSLPLSAGINGFSIAGRDRQGLLVSNALDTVTITNRGPGTLLPVVVNEWMADNAGPFGVADPADELYQDWFELYNPNPVAVNLTGYTLTDDLAQPAKSRIPEGVMIEAKGFLLVWADNQPQQTGKLGTPRDLHVGFQLSAQGEAIGLFSPDGVRQHTVRFGAQAQNVSEGLYPDGKTDGIARLTLWTPRASNQSPAEGAPRILDVQRSERGIATLTFSCFPQRTYRIEATDDIATHVWRTLVDLKANGRVQSWEDPLADSGQRFYRVLLK